MIATIILSQNPHSLDRLLKSIDDNARKTLVDNYVLYTPTEENNNDYLTVIKKWEHTASFILQADFRSDVIKLCKNKSRFICFLVDTCVFYRKNNDSFLEIENAFDELELGCFSLSLGKNTTGIFNPLKTKEDKIDEPVLPHPNYLADLDSKIFVWNTRGTNHINYNTTFTLYGNIVKLKTLQYLINSIQFSDAKSLYQSIQKCSNFFSQIIASYEVSYVVNTKLKKINIDEVKGICL